MILRKPIVLYLPVFYLLALLGYSHTLCAETPDSPKASASQQASHADLYAKLCDLNTNWKHHTPHFEILLDDVPVNGEVSLIQTHLKLVINELRRADVGHLSDKQLAQRFTHIECLRTYMTAGKFPQNVFIAGRRPVFIDPWGTHCAVGYLIAASGHPELAKAINREHQLDFLRDIRTTGLLQWQHDSGLSLDELALIQPTYRSTELRYPEAVEDLILGNSDTLVAGLESGEIEVDARCGGKTLLHLAAAAGDLPLVKRLVEQGADLHAVSSLGCDKAELNKGGRHTLITVRWDQTTAVTNRGRRSIGFAGPVFRTRRGASIVGVLNDLHGGRADWNALEFATQSPNHFGYFPGSYRKTIPIPYGRNASSAQPVPEDETITMLKKKRAAVAEWLQAQGLEAH